MRRLAALNSNHHPRVLLAVLAIGAVSPGQDPDLFELLEQNRLTAWQVLGPWPANDSHGLDVAFIDEAHPNPNEEYAGAQGPLRWRPATGDDSLPDGTANDLGRFGARDSDTLYLLRTLTATADHEAYLSLGMDDSLAVWVNGERVFRQRAEHAVTPDQYAVKVRFRRGDNTILAKVVNQRGGTGFYFQVTDAPQREARWGAGRRDDGFDHYRIETVPLPPDATLEVGGLQFLPTGALLVCTRRGAIFHLADPSATDPAKLRMTEFANGLHEPLGMLLEPDGALLVAQIPELTRLRDTDADGRADRFETVARSWGLSGNYHEYHFGPVRDGDGNLWGTLNIGFPSGEGEALRYRGSAYRITPAGAFEIICYGLRSPNGLVTLDTGDVFYTDNQGEWMDVCRLAHLQPKHFYGHQVPTAWAKTMPDFGWRTERTLPAVWYPYSLMRSTSCPVVDRTAGKFGPYHGQLFVGDQNNALIVRTTLEQVDGVYQGACYPFWQGFACGVNRLAFDAEGVLYVGQTERGWGSVGPKSFGLQRLRYLGKVPFDLLEAKATATGFDLIFNKPLSSDSQLTPSAVLIREYGYKYWSTYGSDEFDSRRIECVKVDVSADRRRVSLTTGPRQTGKAFQIRLRGEVRSDRGERPITQEAFYTLLRIPRT